MKKNGEFVGVDEQFIPEEDKFVDESLLGSREESNKKVKKVAKTVAVGYAVFFGFFIIMFIGMFIFAGINMYKSEKRMDETTIAMQEKHENANTAANNAIIESQKQQEKESFNGIFESDEGVQDGFIVQKFTIRDIISNNETNSERKVSVEYNGIIAIETNDIITIRDSLNRDEYIIKVEYDEEGYVNKVIIKDM